MALVGVEVFYPMWKVHPGRTLRFSLPSAALTHFHSFERTDHFVFLASNLSVTPFSLSRFIILHGFLEINRPLLEVV